MDPGLHDTVHARPVRLGSGNGGVGEDVIPKRELADDEKKLIPPVSVVAGDVEDDGDQAPDVLDRHSLRVEVHDGSSLVNKQGVVKILGARVGGAAGVLIVVVVGEGWSSGALALSAR